MKNLIAMRLFELGLLVSLLDEIPVVPGHGLRWINSDVSLVMAVSLGCWLAAEGLLTWNSWTMPDRTYWVHELNCLGALVLALAPLSALVQVSLRGVCSVLCITSVVVLYKYLTKEQLIACLRPFRGWRKVYRGIHGPRANWLLGTEFNATAFTIIGTWPISGWAALAIACMWLTRWNTLDLHGGLTESANWVRVNKEFLYGSLAHVVLRLCVPMVAA